MQIFRIIRYVHAKNFESTQVSENLKILENPEAHVRFLKNQI